MQSQRGVYLGCRLFHTSTYKMSWNEQNSTILVCVCEEKEGSTQRKIKKHSDCILAAQRVNTAVALIKHSLPVSPPWPAKTNTMTTDIFRTARQHRFLYFILQKISWYTRYTFQPEFFLEWSQQSAGNIPKRFWSITQMMQICMLLHSSYFTTSQGCSAGLISCVEATEVHWTHCHVGGTSLRWHVFCNMIHYAAGGSYSKKKNGRL